MVENGEPKILANKQHIVVVDRELMSAVVINPDDAAAAPGEATATRIQALPLLLLDGK